MSGANRWGASGRQNRPSPGAGTARGGSRNKGPWWLWLIVGLMALITIATATAQSEDSPSPAPTVTITKTETSEPVPGVVTETVTETVTEEPAGEGLDSEDDTATKPEAVRPSEDVYYENCDAARAAGAAPVYAGEPGYGPHLDRDGDGVACEP